MAITFFDKNSGTDKIVKFNANKHSEISLVNLNSPRGLFQLLVEKHNGDQKVLGKFSMPFKQRSVRNPNFMCLKP